MLTQSAPTIQISARPYVCSCTEMSMSVALVMETICIPGLEHVVTVLLDEGYRALLLLCCRNAEIRAFWSDLLVHPTHTGRSHVVPIEPQGDALP